MTVRRFGDDPKVDTDAPLREAVRKLVADLGTRSRNIHNETGEWWVPLFESDYKALSAAFPQELA
jgi:hypothetical protein